MKKVIERIRKYMSDIIGNSIYDILKFVLLSSSGVSVTGYAVQRIIEPYFSTLFVVIITAVVIGITTMLILWGYKKHRKYKYKIQDMNVNFEYTGDKIIATTETTVVSNRNDLSSIYSRYSWFDDEKSTVTCLTKGMKIKCLPKKDTSNEYLILLGRKLRKGDVITYKTRVCCENKHKHFNNFYSREIIRPVGNLTITVIVPSKFGYNKIERSKIKGSAYSDASDTEVFDFINTHTWNIGTRVEVGCEYKLIWHK